MSKPHIARMGGRWYAGTRQAPDLRTHAHTPRRAVELLHFFRRNDALTRLVGTVEFGEEPPLPAPAGMEWVAGHFGFNCAGQVRQNPPRLEPAMPAINLTFHDLPSPGLLTPKGTSGQVD